MFQLTVEDVFRIRNRGVVATGRVASGAVRVGDTVEVGGTAFTVKAVEMFRKKVDTATEGDTVGLLFDDDPSGVLQRGATMTGDGVAPSAVGADVAEAARRAGLGGGEPPKRRWFGGR